VGAQAFLTDIFRELYSITFLYLLGSKYSPAAIGISGAAALDTALPFIKENCDDHFITQAIFSGLLLTLVAPFLLFSLASVLINFY
jgi:uncharacterized membrane protein YbjE (DUF340 family)